MPRYNTVRLTATETRVLDWVLTHAMEDWAILSLLLPRGTDKAALRRILCKVNPARGAGGTGEVAPRAGGHHSEGAPANEP
jgi:hypothetical protein